MHTLRVVLTWTRAVAVTVVWLVVLPWCVRWSWRAVFCLINPWRPFNNYRSVENYDATCTLAKSSTSTLLSNITYLNSLTSSAGTNRIILDVLEGQILIAFILALLVSGRTWSRDGSPSHPYTTVDPTRETTPPKKPERKSGLAIAVNNITNDINKTAAPDDPEQETEVAYLNATLHGVPRADSDFDHQNNEIDQARKSEDLGQYEQEAVYADVVRGDITPHAKTQLVSPFREAIIQDRADEAQLLRAPAAEADLEDDLPNELPVQDPKVSPVEAEAGLDANDLDEILELIGMKGPLTKLLLNAIICGMLFTATLWAAIGVSYLCGKLALIVFDNLFVLMVAAPLWSFSIVAIVLVDFTICLGGLMLYRLAQALFRLRPGLYRRS